MDDQIYADDTETMTEADLKAWHVEFTTAAYLAFLINHKTSFCVFFNLSGHVANVSISLRRSKKQYNEHVADAEFQSHPGRAKGYPTTSLERLREINATLRAVLEREDVPYDLMTSEVIVVKETVWTL